MTRLHLRSWSLRSQLTALLIASVTVLVLVTGLAGAASLRNYLVGRIDTQLVAALDDRPPSALRTEEREGRHGPGEDVAVTTLDYDAHGVLSSTDASRLASFGGPAIASPGSLPDVPTDVADVQSGRQWRVLAGPDGQGGITVVAVALDGVDDTTSRLLVIDAAAGLLALLGAGLLASWAVRRSLRPLREVEETAMAIAGGNLDVRVPESDLRTEVGSLAASFNIMVERFSSAWTAQQESEQQARTSEERMRRFVADASHELRTPLTSIRGFAELSRHGFAEPVDQARFMERIEAESTRMGALVEDLLLLARLDQARPVATEPVDLLAVASDVVHDAAAVHAAGHTVTLLPPSGSLPPVVLGDDARLRQVVTNLVGNALSHTPAGTSVEVGLHADATGVVLSVMDDGPGMAADVSARVFERFYRADASRTRTVDRTRTGSGLGLSIVSSLVVAHGGTVDVQSAPGHGTTFSVRLPAALAAVPA